jgi:FkbM family methyltransferase
MSGVVDGLLSELGIRPVLVDVGASGAPPGVWRKISRHSIYVGFDPDLREVHEIPEGDFFRSVIVNEAVTGIGQSGEVEFYLTKSPYCSSTLPPDAKSLSDYFFSDLFNVEKTSKVRAGTLDAVLARFSLPGVDWLKTDSQGTDLRIFHGLKEEMRRRVLAVDMEPGLIDAYAGEDLFVDAHRELTRGGFWLSSLNVHGTVRMRRSTLPELGLLGHPLNEGLIRMAVRTSPGWCESRYLRTVESIGAGPDARRDHILLWVFSLLDRQPGFALDLAVEYRKRYGEDGISERLLAEPVQRIRYEGRRKRIGGWLSLPLRIFRRLKNELRLYSFR